MQLKSIGFALFFAFAGDAQETSPTTSQTGIATTATKSSSASPMKTKSVKIHGYITALRSPSEFEIDEYRITKDSAVTLEFERSEDPQEKATFNAEEIRVGTEMEIKGELDEATGQLKARTIKINLDEHRRVKRTALMEVAPEIRKAGNAWEGQLHADGQQITINQNTVLTIKPNNSQKKAIKESAKAAKKQHQIQKSDSDEEPEEPGVALSRPDQIPGNTFISYEGVRQKDGTILATKLEFTESELTTAEVRLWKTLNPKVKMPNLISARPGDLFIQNVGKFKIVPNAALQKYLQDLGMSLIPKSQVILPSGDPRKIPFRFFVVEKKEPNAFALANGTVVVNSGLLAVAENEAQVAFVLSHEISHAVEKHTYRQMQYHKKALLTLRVAGAVAAAKYGKGIGDLANLTATAIQKGYQRSLENQSDRVGMEHMMAAGYDPREAPRFWKVMSLKSGDHRTDFWSDHDNNTTRRSYLISELTNNYASIDFANSRRNSESFTAIVGTMNAARTPKKAVKVKY
jgi:hypothetical protein